MSDQASSDKPVVLLRPAPQIIERIFSADALRRLRERYTVIDGEADPSEEAIEACLPEVFAIIGQPDLPAERLERAPKLRGILNVEGNFFQNVDYEAAFARGVNVAVCAPVYAQAVAEHALGLAIDLARGISREDRAFREGRERWVSAGNQDAILLRGAEMGILGYGNIGRRLLPLLAAFRPARVRCYDPWLPDAVIRDAGMEPASLEETLSTSTFLFILATVTEESTHLLDADKLRLIPRWCAGHPLEPRRRRRLRRAGPRRGRGPLPLRHRRLARGARASRPPGARGSKAWSSRPTGRAASPRPSTRSARWSSTTSDLMARGLPPVRNQLAVRELRGPLPLAPRHVAPELGPARRPARPAIRGGAPPAACRRRPRRG